MIHKFFMRFAFVMAAILTVLATPAHAHGRQIIIVKPAPPPKAIVKKHPHCHHHRHAAHCTRHHHCHKHPGRAAAHAIADALWWASTH